jgi:hypothetical protein
MTDIRNWNDPPAEFSLDGPFDAGTRGTTRIPGQPDAHWIIRAVEPERQYTIEGSIVPGAVLLVHWRFDAISERTAQLTQRLELFGEHASAHVDGIRSAFEPNLEPGMRRIAQTMERLHGGTAGDDRTDK